MHFGVPFHGLLYDTPSAKPTSVGLPYLSIDSVTFPESIRLDCPEYVDTSVPELIHIIRIEGINVDRAIGYGIGDSCPSQGTNQGGRTRDSRSAERGTGNDTVGASRICRDDVDSRRIHEDVASVIREHRLLIEKI